jgi:hypothetical protein
MKPLMTPSIDELMSDRHCFNSFVYTPVEQAMQELESRKNDKTLSRYLNQNLPFGIPGCFEGEKNIVFGRQIASPNFELKQFLSVADTLPEFKKTIIVKHNDKFTPGNNETKYHLAKIVFNSGHDGNSNTKSIMAVDFNQYAGKQMTEVKTIWGQNLVDFHNELLDYSLRNKLNQDINQFEASNWLLQLGKTAKEYYPKLLLLFLQNGMLFENFLMKEKGEATFTKEVFLPAFLKIINETGVKPLIVSVLPFDSEENNFWNYYPEEYFEFVRNKLVLTKTLLSKVAA